jgi:SAM-dependent methyltransferase
VTHPLVYTYGAVDQSPDPSRAVNDQERVNAWPAIRAYKSHAHELLAHASLVLDVGCGPGTDAALLGPGRVVGLDPSSAMCQRARARGVTVCGGDAVALPFTDETFDACRADRVLQHLTNPTEAIHELIRVTRRGGRIVVADPDQETLTIQVPGVSKALTDQIKRLRRDIGYRNGRLASTLPSLFTDLGLDDIEITAFPLVLTDPDDAFGLPKWPRLWHASGIRTWTDEDLAQWDQAIQTSRDRGFVYALVYFVVTATRP